jgi:predicted nucleic acid-binding Zn ribbon protein
MPRWRPLHEAREPRRLGEAIDRVLPGGRAFTTLVEQWSELVGDNLASHARPAALHATTLVVAVEDPAWATQLRYLEQDLVERCREVLGAGLVTEVRVVVRSL